MFHWGLSPKKRAVKGRGVMGSALATYLALVGVFAALLVTHAVLVVRVLRSRGVRATGKALAIVPPVTPVVAWRAGARVGAVVWIVLLLGYAVLLAVANA